MEKTTQNKTKLIISIIFMIVLVIALILFTIWLWPYFRSLQTPEGQAKFRAWIDGFGFWGFAIVLGLQILQVVVAFIPGQITELLAGMLYGIPGVFISLAGAGIAALLIFGLVKQFGKPIVDFFVSERDRKHLGFITNARRLEAILLFSFLLPGVPKDAVTYLAATTKVKTVRFLIIMLVGRFPATFLSTIIGHKFGKGQFDQSFLLTIISVAFAIVLIVFSKPIIRFFENKMLK